MRIAYLTQSYPPMISGASFAAGELAEEMSDRGHNVLVIAASEREYAYTHIEGDRTVVRLSSINNPLRVGQRVLLTPRRKVLKNLQDFQPDLIHVHEPFQLGLLGLQYAKQHHIPIILTTHQLPWFIASYMPNKFHIRDWVEKTLWLYASWLLKRFSAIIAPTKTVSKIICDKTSVNPKTIHYGIDLQTFHPRASLAERDETRAQYGLPANVPIILHTGRLDTDKLVQRVLLAAAETLSHSNAHLLIVGDGNQKWHLMELCRSLGIESRTHFTGFISDKKELARIYRMSNVFVTASEIETQGIVILEAAACGLPIVAVRATCIPEVVQDGENGFLCEPGDINGLSKSIERIIADNDLAQAMRIKSRLVAERFGSESTFIKHETLYQEIVTENSSFYSFTTGKPESSAPHSVHEPS
ncbi:MAG: glycosyltransferase [Chloroflexota bacterium]